MYTFSDQIHKNVHLYANYLFYIVYLDVHIIIIDLQVQIDQTNLDSYTKTRERALLQLVFDMTVKNASFILDRELIEIIKLHKKEKLTLLYNAMAACGLHSIDSWKCILSYTQTMATCAVCTRPVLWHKNDIPVNVDRFGYY